MAIDEAESLPREPARRVNAWLPSSFHTRTPTSLVPPA
jgi:hypothetical protein